MPQPSVNTDYDVTYARPAGAALRLDLAWPVSGGPHPLVLLLHGGGWHGGERATLHDLMRTLAGRGYAAASVDYRLALAPRDIFPAAAQDVRAALGFLRAEAGSFGIAPSRVAAMGFSAGGHLAALLATAPDGTAGALGASVQAVVAYAAPHDLRVDGPHTREQVDLVTNFLGAFPGDEPERAALASPIVHVRAGAPPFLLVHGAADELVPVAQARRMAEALRAVGTPVTLVELPGAGHSMAALDPALRQTADQARDAFLARWLVATPSSNEAVSASTRRR